MLTKEATWWASKIMCGRTFQQIAKWRIFNCQERMIFSKSCLRWSFWNGPAPWPEVGCLTIAPEAPYPKFWNNYPITKLMTSKWSKPQITREQFKGIPSTFLGSAVPRQHAKYSVDWAPERSITTISTNRSNKKLKIQICIRKNW